MICIIGGFKADLTAVDLVDIAAVGKGFPAVGKAFEKHHILRVDTASQDVALYILIFKPEHNEQLI